MQKSTIYTLLVFGGLLLLANSAFAVTAKPRPGPIITPPPTTPQPVVSAN